MTLQDKLEKFVGELYFEVAANGKFANTSKLREAIAKRFSLKENCCKILLLWMAKKEFEITIAKSGRVAVLKIPAYDLVDNVFYLFNNYT